MFYSKFSLSLDLVPGHTCNAYTRLFLHEMVRKSTEKNFNRKLSDLEDKMAAMTKCPPQDIDKFKKVMNNFKIVYKRYWQACKSTQSLFLTKHHDWLQQTIELPCALLAKSPGRPSKEFGECSERSKRRKTMDIRQNVPLDQLTFAAEMSNRAAGNNDAAKLIHDIQKSPTRASKYRKIVFKQRTSTYKHSPEEALRIFVEANLTRAQYEIIQRANKEVYPCYALLLKVKQDTYPCKIVSETEAEVKLQDLVNNTAERLCKYLENVIDMCSESEKRDMTLTYKWGCDGSQQNCYKQKFQKQGDSDANVFISSMVPLRLTCGTKTIWTNPTPSSPRFCRPIRIRFVKESNDITNDEIKYIEQQAKELQKTKLGDTIKINHILLPTMVDGKVCNAATENKSTMRCFICGKTQRFFNDLTLANEENPSTFKFGLSTLHARIRMFEFLLHLSYKLKANVHSSRVLREDKALIQAAKETIQRDFKEKMGLLVDIPKVHFGNTNDGNTSRRFFNEIEVAAEITGINIELIKRFKVILEVLSSGFDIQTEKFGNYTLDTAKIFVDLYPWQPMSPTVHKILIHSKSVIEHALLPIGQLSEEASEARNKHFRLYRESFSRKFSRTACMEDIINKLLLTSDPYISSLRQRSYKNKKGLSNEALEFLKSSIDGDQSDDDNEDDD